MSDNESSHNNATSSGLEGLDTNDLNMSLLANKVKLKDTEEDYETSIEATPAFENINMSDKEHEYEDEISEEEVIENPQWNIQNKTEPILVNDTNKEVIEDDIVHSQSDNDEQDEPVFFASENSDYGQKEYSPREERKKKFELIYKIKALAKKGIAEPYGVDMSSSIGDIELVYNEMYESYNRKNSVALQRKMLVMSATLVEFLNNRYDPFDFKLDGWSESVYDSINNEEYDEVLEELHEKYKSKAKMAPEVKILMMLGGSAFMHHTLSSAFKTSAPATTSQATQPNAKHMSGPSGLDDILNSFRGT